MMIANPVVEKRNVVMKAKSQYTSVSKKIIGYNLVAFGVAIFIELEKGGWLLLLLMNLGLLIEFLEQKFLERPSKNEMNGRDQPKMK